MKSIVFISMILVSTLSRAAPFEEVTVPTAIYHLTCDASPRIVVQFSGGIESIWFPANGAFSKEFLSTALAAKTSNSAMYYYGADNVTTPYCISRGIAREVYLFGIQ